VVAAILTPSPDAVSQLLMAVPLMFLYEVSIIVTKWVERKKPVFKTAVVECE
jgi:sec-independent protein translocase protein TatC